MKTFPRGGVHPPENKKASGFSIEVLPLPKSVCIHLSQHLGAPAEPLVAKGDTVKAGQLIAKSTGFVSANIHSPVSGTVQKIEPAPDSSGYKRPAIFIEVQGDEWLETIDRSPNLIKSPDLTSEEIIARVGQMGIVGLGGATFPSHVKITVPKGKKAEILIINGVECEPYLTSDHRLMLEKGEEILVGTQLLMKALRVNQAVIGIERNKPDAISHLTRLCARYPGIRVEALKVKYPQGGEKQLIKAITGREVPSGRLPIDVGAVVYNVGTAFAVYEAITKNKPLFERIVTVTGKSMERTANYLVRIGTPVTELIEATGGMPEDTGKVINGGPMMGKALPLLDVPVTKGTSGIVLMPVAESNRRTTMNCIRCSRCNSVCAMGLEPYFLMSLGEAKRWDDMEQERVMDCMECGSCSYTCPSGRPLLDYIRLGKNSVNRIIRSRSK
ncbi:MAG: electron transport complex subunit RsxC [Bacteroidales bacterium]